MCRDPDFHCETHWDNAERVFRMRQKRSIEAWNAGKTTMTPIIPKFNKKMLKERNSKAAVLRRMEGAETLEEEDEEDKELRESEERERELEDDEEPHTKEQGPRRKRFHPRWVAVPNLTGEES